MMKNTEKPNSNDNMSLNKILKLHNLIIVKQICFSRRQEVLSTKSLR